MIPVNDELIFPFVLSTKKIIGVMTNKNPNLMSLEASLFSFE